MCSVDPDEVTEMTRVTAALDITSGGVVCRKCKQCEAVVVLRVKDAYCRLCFMSYFVHKFRSTIGKSKLIRAGERVLVASSGGPSSSTLLHLIHSGLTDQSHKKLRFIPAFLYIDESCLSNSPSTGPPFTQQMCGDVVSLDFPCYVTSLEQVMATSPPPPVLYSQEHVKATPHSDIDLQKKLRDLIFCCKSASAQQGLHEQLRHQLLLHCARALGYSKLFLGDNATKLSVQILTQVAEGRGSQLPKKVHFQAVYGETEVYRPMRELLEHEVLCYMELQGLPQRLPPTLPPTEGSITACTDKFIRGLQREYPATIPTIFRTGDKLTSSSSTSCSLPSSTTSSLADLHSSDAVAESTPINDCAGDPCVLCGAPLDTYQSETSALHATVVSQRLSCKDTPATGQQETAAGETRTLTNDCRGDTESSEGCKEEQTEDGTVTSKECSCSRTGGCGSSSKHKVALTREVVERYLCYGCRIIVREMEDLDQLPATVQAAVGEQTRRHHMREQIQDFLL